MNNQFKVLLTAFVLRIRHESLLHRFWILDLVFFFNVCCCCGSDLLFSYNFQSFQDRNVPKSLGNGKSSLSILKEQILLVESITKEMKKATQISNYYESVKIQFPNMKMCFFLLKTQIDFKVLVISLQLRDQRTFQKVCRYFNIKFTFQPKEVFQKLLI